MLATSCLHSAHLLYRRQQRSQRGSYFLAGSRLSQMLSNLPSSPRVILFRIFCVSCGQGGSSHVNAQGEPKTQSSLSPDLALTSCSAFTSFGAPSCQGPRVKSRHQCDKLEDFWPSSIRPIVSSVFPRSFRTGKGEGKATATRKLLRRKKPPSRGAAPLPEG